MLKRSTTHAVTHLVSLGLTVTACSNAPIASGASGDPREPPNAVTDVVDTRAFD